MRIEKFDRFPSEHPLTPKNFSDACTIRSPAGSETERPSGKEGRKKNIDSLRTMAANSDTQGIDALEDLFGDYA